MSLHNERCPVCKETIKRLLETIYGKVETEFKIDVGTHPKDFIGLPCYEKLKEIYVLLQNFRGNKDFVRSEKLPPCDFYIPSENVVVEFDEKQHFTQPRKITLEHYPNLDLGFDKKKWIRLCDKINAKDNYPPFRDEQRAWYDCIRDFLPLIKGLKPTIRLYAGDLVWCNLSTDSPEDVEKFKTILSGNSLDWKIKVIEDPSPICARIIIADQWNGDGEDARKVLEKVLKNFPKGKKVKFLITCGGFIQFDWPKQVTKTEIGNNLYPNFEALNILVEEAKDIVRKILSDDLEDRLREITDWLSLGIDSYKEENMKPNYINHPHIELVLLFDLRNDKVYWTGKSYPTVIQENGLVRIPDLNTHFVDVEGLGKVMILGCHDLNMFNPRSIATSKGWRKEVGDDFIELAKKEKPTCVLQHPHTAVKVKTWSNAWNGLMAILPSVKFYFGAGKYHELERNRSEYDPIHRVLSSTKLGASIDFIVDRA